MRTGVVICVALFVTFTSASPLTLERTKDEPMRVVDVPAGIFETETEEKPIVKDESAKVDVVAESPAVDDKKQVELIGPLADDKPVKVGTEETENEQGPNIFGFNFRPSIIIFRRPAIMQNPFSGFQSPFFSRRPSIFSPFSSSEDDREVEEPLSIKDDDQKQNTSETKVVNDVIQRMHQQMNNLFANLFNPETFFMPRPTFSRPSFFAPVPAAESTEEEDNIDFAKLPDNYHNSTSETKVVDGQLVTVNKTVHRVSGNNSNGFFQFSIIKIRPNKPDESPETKLPTTPVVVPAASTNPEISETTKVESVTSDKKPQTSEMDPQLNEVDQVDEADKEPKLPEVELNNKYDIATEGNSPADSQQRITEEDIKIIPIMPAKLIKASSGTKRITDLSNDIRVNNLMEEAANNGRLRALFDPDEVEVFDV